MGEWGEHGARGRIYRALRIRGEKGVTDGEITSAGIPMPWPHVLSLMSEGHGIRLDNEKDDRGRPIRRYVLVEDAWETDEDDDDSEDS
jgi:hypothetical protein